MNIAGIDSVERYSSIRAGGQVGTFRRWNSSNPTDETHDDFKPQYKGEAPKSISELVDSDVKAHGVFVYMKGIPEAPMCGFSNMACRILDAYEVEYGSRDVLADPDLREGIKKYTHWPTIPQIFIGGEFVGGCDILMEMHQNGELKQALQGLKAD
jgi:monothiol glutaredoxin